MASKVYFADLRADYHENLQQERVGYLGNHRARSQYPGYL